MPGDEVKKNQLLFVIEAMKMESIVAAQQPGTVKQDNWVVEMA